MLREISQTFEAKPCLLCGKADAYIDYNGGQRFCSKECIRWYQEQEKAEMSKKKSPRQSERFKELASDVEEAYKQLEWIQQHRDRFGAEKEIEGLGDLSFIAYKAMMFLNPKASKEREPKSKTQPTPLVQTASNEIVVCDICANRYSLAENNGQCWYCHKKYDESMTG